MANLRTIVVALSAVVTCTLTPAAHAQTPAAQQKPETKKPVVKSVAARPIASVDGAENFQEYCAVCHGKEAKGDGPAAPAMKAPVPDLTLIAKRHDGKFDDLEIQYIIKGTGKSMTTPAHGVETMPIWGEFFRAGGDADPNVTTLRVNNLVNYLKSIQR